MEKLELAIKSHSNKQYLYLEHRNSYGANMVVHLGNTELLTCKSYGETLLSKLKEF